MLKEYLLALSIGPVQGFIAAARRTRDLWFGSYILSEVSKAAARFLDDMGATLIFPAPKNKNLLAADSELQVTNHIMALVPEDLDPEKLADCAKKAARYRWLIFAESTLETVGREKINSNIWEEQVIDVLELYAAWVPWDSSKTSYQKARERLNLVLDGRKALRDFLPASGNWKGIPKSSLDGARESVLSLTGRADVRRRFKIKKNEHLDSVGLIKRCAPMPGGDQHAEFVSVVRVAADPWIRGKAKTEQGKSCFKKIGDLCCSDFAPRIYSEVYANFPYDATPLYISRLKALQKDPDMEPYKKNLTEIEIIIQKNFKKGDQPSPYYAVLLADGDHMGAVLSKMQNPEEHQKFSSSLSDFSQEVRKIIEDHYGCLVYSGGDDVLAFLPVDQCLSAARELHDFFESKLSQENPALGTDVPTLSVGIAIGYCFDPLEDMLTSAREALKDAKDGRLADRYDKRNGLAVHYLPRGAEAIRVRDRWENKPDRRLEKWIEYLNSDSLSDRTVYDLHALAGDYTGWKCDSLQDLVVKELERILSKKKPAGKKMSEDVIDTLKAEIEGAADLDRLACELLVARHMAPIFSQAADRTGTASQKEESMCEGKEGGD